jgi:predicted metalloendopeptidase
MTDLERLKNRLLDAYEKAETETMPKQADNYEYGRYIGRLGGLSQALGLLRKLEAELDFSTQGRE